MSDEVSPADIRREWERAEQAFEDAREAHEVDISKATVVNRLYYACFHAAQAVLYSRGFDPGSHGAVGTLLGRELVGGGDIDRRHGRFLNDMETFRRRVDYGSGAVERGTDDLLEGIEAFLNAMRTALDDESITG